MTGAERILLLDVAQLFFRRAGLIAWVVLCFAAAGVTATTLWPARYTAVVRLAVAPGTDGSGRAARDQAELLRDPGLVRRVLPVIQAVLPGDRPGVMGQALRRFGGAWGRSLAGASPVPTADELARQVEQALRVRVAGDTDVVVVSFGWDDPVFAATALNAVVGAYQQTGSDSADALEILGRAQVKLEAAQAEMRDLDRQAGALGPAMDGDAARAERGRIDMRLTQARGMADTVRLSRALAQQKLESLEQSYGSGGWIAGGDSARPLAAGFTALLDKRGQLLSAGRADSAEMRALDREIARVREQNYAVAREAAQRDVSVLDDRLGKLEAGIADDDATLRALDKHMSETDLLGQARQEKMARLAQAQQEVAAAHAHTESGWQAVGGARVVSQAVPPAAADWPGPGLVMGGMALLGLLAGVGLAFWAEARRRTIEGTLDVSGRLGLDVLARLGDVPLAQLR